MTAGKATRSTGDDMTLTGRAVVLRATEAMQVTARRRGVDDDTLYLLALDAAFALRGLFRVDPWAPAPTEEDT